MEETYSFGTWLKQRRRALDLTQAELARRLGCATVTLQKIELDDRRPSKDIAERLAEVLEIAPAERATFLKSARGELAVDHLAVSQRDVPAPWRPTPRPAHNLPVPPTPLIGREREVATIVALLEEPAVRLLTLIGPGGTGKTRLAIAAAYAVVDTFGDGVTFVALAAISDPALVLPTIAQTLGIRETSGQMLAARLAYALRARQMVLVLDNFEQILAAASDVAALLSAAPQIKVVVTSRAVLHLSGEQEYPVSPLALPDPHHLPALAELTQYEAVALFIARARAVKPDFPVTNENAPAVAEICARLDGLPLAVELAAARSRLFEPPALLARLTNRLHFLTGGARDLPTRQQTIRNTIDWSFSLLGPSEQRLFTRLGIFVGGWTVEAAEAVCNADGDLGMDVLDGLATLVEHSLVRQVVGTDGEPRFRRLETIREYAVERLQAGGEADMLAQRHATYYQAFAEETDRQIRDLVVSDEAGATWLRREQENLRAALHWARNVGAADVGLSLAAALWWFWEVHAPQEGLSWLTTLLALPGPVAPRVRARALVVAAAMAANHSVGDHGAVHAWATESLALSRALDDTSGAGWALLFLARAAGARRSGQTRALIEESLALFVEAGDAMGLLWVSFAYNILPELGLAQDTAGPVYAALEQSLARFRRERKPLACAVMSSFLGGLARGQGDYGRARFWLEEALRLAQQLGDREELNNEQHQLGELMLLLGDDARAWDLEAASLAGFRERGNKNGMQMALINLGYVARHLGKQGQAAAMYLEALAIGDEIGDRGHTIECLAGLAGLAEPSRAARLFGAAEALREVDRSQPVLARRRQIERNIVAARAQLDPDAWDAAWAEGRAMTLEQAIAYALEGADAQEGHGDTI